MYENGTPFEPRIVDLSDEASRAAFLRLWPIGKFPVLRDEARDRLIPELSIIIEYLDQHYPGPAPLVPADPDLALKTRLADRFYDLYVHEPMQKIVGDRLRPAGERDAFGVAQAKARLQTAYAMIDAEMATQMWAAGETFTAADCAAAPALFYARLVLPFGDAHLESRPLLRTPDGSSLLRAGGRGGEALFRALPAGGCRRLTRARRPAIEPQG